MEKELLLTTAWLPDKQRWCAVITSGGHPQLNRDEVVVLSVEVFDRKNQAKKWFERMKIERPWETRQ